MKYLVNLDEIRANIDDINISILKLFSKRLELCGKVASYKQENSLPVNDSKREAEILKKISELSEWKYAEYNKELFCEIFRISKEYQEKIMEQDK